MRHTFKGRRQPVLLNRSLLHRRVVFLSKLPKKIQLVTCFKQVELKTGSFWPCGLLTCASSSCTFLTRLRRVFFPPNVIFNVFDSLLLMTSPADRPLASNPLAFFFSLRSQKKPRSFPKETSTVMWREP